MQAEMGVRHREGRRPGGGATDIPILYGPVHSFQVETVGISMAGHAVTVPFKGALVPRARDKRRRVHG